LIPPLIYLDFKILPNPLFPFAAGIMFSRFFFNLYSLITDDCKYLIAALFFDENPSPSDLLPSLFILMRFSEFDSP